MYLFLKIRELALHFSPPDIFMSHRGQPVDQAGYTECGYFGNMSGSAFSTMSAEPLFHPDNQLQQVS